jgi:hypothetical protein
MDEIADIVADDIDPRDKIERLETRIEALTDQIESCRKFILAGRVAAVLGAALLAAGLFGLILIDGLILTVVFAAVLGGIVVAGSNGSTAKQASAQREQAEAARAALIGVIELRVVSERPTLH